MLSEIENGRMQEFVWGKTVRNLGAEDNASGWAGFTQKGPGLIEKQGNQNIYKQKSLKR